MKATDKLRVYWSKKENDLMFFFPLGQQTKCDASYLYSAVFSAEVLRELEARGYDLTTIKFEISPKQGSTRFASQRESPLMKLAEVAKDL